MSVFICSKCGKSYDANTKFCSECGGKIEEKIIVDSAAETVYACVGCGKKYDANTKFCSECGGKICPTFSSSSQAEVQQYMKPVDLVKEYFGKTIQYLKSVNFFNAPSKTLFFASDDPAFKYAATKTQIEKMISEWNETVSVNPEDIIFIYEITGTLGESVVGGFISTAGISWFSQKNAFSMTKDYHCISWNDIYDIKVLDGSEDYSDPQNLGEVFTEAAKNIGSAFMDVVSGINYPCILINNKIFVSVHPLHPKVDEWRNFLAAMTRK